MWLSSCVKIGQWFLSVANWIEATCLSYELILCCCISCPHVLSDSAIQLHLSWDLVTSIILLWYIFLVLTFIYYRGKKATYYFNMFSVLISKLNYNFLYLELSGIRKFEPTKVLLGWKPTWKYISSSWHERSL